MPSWKARIGDVRVSIQDQLDMLSFTGRIWQIFRAVISGSLYDLQKNLGDSAEAIMQIVDNQVNNFFVQSLQLDTFTLRLEYE